MARKDRDTRPGFTTTPGSYRGPVPVVTHLHGAHVPEESDGYPEAWYLPAATDLPHGYARVGTFYDRFKAESAGHTGVVFAKPLAVNPITRAWINDYVPSPEPAPPPKDAGVDLANLVLAADIWYSVKKHWCLEAQRMIRALRKNASARQ